MKRLITILFAVALGPASWGQSECGELLDSDQDGFIGVEDLMNLLSLFGDTDADLDGIWDSVDDCVGVYDACGVCGGTGEDVDSDGNSDRKKPNTKKQGGEQTQAAPEIKTADISAPSQARLLASLWLLYIGLLSPTLGVVGAEHIQVSECV